MAVMDVRNSSSGWLTLWLEPLGEDRWLSPDETLRVRSEYNGDEVAFFVDFSVSDDDRSAGIDNVTVWIEGGSTYAEVTDLQGQAVECGHQRPEEINDRWKSAAQE